MHSFNDIDTHLRRHRRWYWTVPKLGPWGKALWWGIPLMLVALGVGSFVLWKGFVGVVLITLSVFLASGGGLAFHYMRQRFDVIERSQIIVHVASIVPAERAQAWSGWLETIHHQDNNNALWWTKLDQLCKNMPPVQHTFGSSEC